MGYPYGPPGREFRMAAGGFGRMDAPFIAMLVFFFAIMLLLGSIFGGLLIGIPVAVVATGALVGVLVRLAWPDITRLGQVDTRMAGSDKIGEDGGVKVGVGSMKSLGLVGWGERVTPPNIPDWTRQNLAHQPGVGGPGPYGQPARY